MQQWGVQQITVNVNKMDTVDYKEDAFNKVKEEVSALLKTVGIDAEKTPFLAVSGLKGDNIKDKSENMSWYKGPTIWEQLDLFEEPKKPTPKIIKILPSITRRIRTLNPQKSKNNVHPGQNQQQSTPHPRKPRATIPHPQSQD